MSTLKRLRLLQVLLEMRKNMYAEMILFLNPFRLKMLARQGSSNQIHHFDLRNAENSSVVVIYWLFGNNKCQFDCIRLNV